MTPDIPDPVALAGPLPALGAPRPRSIVLQQVWRQREVSRADLSRTTGLSRSTVSGVASELIDVGLIREIREGTSSGGRRPIILGFVDDARVVLGLDIGAAHVGVVLTDLRGRILRRASRQLDARNDPDAALASVLELGRQLLGGDGHRLLGVGLGLPAPIRPDSGLPHATILPRWQGRDPIALVKEAFGAPVRVDNDANLGALAELWWGAGRGRRDLVFVKVATGVGAGIIIDGRVVTGVHGLAGELGHLSVDPNGPPCVCGVNGCLNVVVGTQALLERTRARLPHFRGSVLDEPGLDLAQLIAATHERDPLALEIMRFAGERLGDGLGNLLNVLDPGVLILGGELVEAGDALLEPIRVAVARRTLTHGGAAQKVVRSQVDAQVVALGAATAILSAALVSLDIPLIGAEVHS